ncbi:hypothetical protein B0T25DRAFT_81298 [Lasiosphaeria hispida]|uniref:Transmembrane protein n=1 Tax=Lasiosphaeria hispida TaxID=260671 RepID=A0AAJ0MH81_9PEZI|nr:hypothetical protein B0T25DRAFT_81298 [Lasiosphaeria hispida]
MVSLREGMAGAGTEACIARECKGCIGPFSCSRIHRASSRLCYSFFLLRIFLLFSPAVLFLCPFSFYLTDLLLLIRSSLIVLCLIFSRKLLLDGRRWSTRNKGGEGVLVRNGREGR